MRCEIFTTKKELIRTKGNFREVIIQTSSILILILILILMFSGVNILHGALSISSENVNKIQVSDNFDPRKTNSKKTKNSLNGSQFFNLFKVTL